MNFILILLIKIKDLDKFRVVNKISLKTFAKFIKAEI